MNIRGESIRILTIFMVLVFLGVFSPGASEASLDEPVPPATPIEVTMDGPALIGGDPVTTTFGIQNQDTEAQIQLYFNLSGSCGFTSDTLPQGVILNPDDIVNVTVTFEPTALGACSDPLIIYCLVGGKFLSVEVTLTGEGVDELPPTTVIIDGCDTGVTDLEFGEKRISEWVNGCAKDVKTHRNFVSRVARLTAKMRKEGLISRVEKRAIRNCARKANIPSLQIGVGTTEKGTITIGGRDTGVGDQTYEGYAKSEWIQQCVDDSNTHGKFVTCVSHLTRDMKREGIISWKEEHVLQRYAAKAK